MSHLLSKHGISDFEWFRATVNEAQSDPVGMWSMIRAGREGFALNGGELEDFVRRFVVEMITAGAVPIKGDKKAPFGWSPVPRYGGEPAKVADSLIGEWQESKSDPGLDGIWFAFPSVWK
ncbi:hypothetical protein D3874_03590 [Oleomonas cavernae]|uniref:Uncharacterized protein n=1 Tax=Oleomonas cavernae TaxID=2320859 RepID=A0A418WUT0_9PROT|nr:hypothetical protein [Oleomonas cavernae]RJF94907.1 hypothetical protein D3874_03590 [Oleomonas cavernae]